MAPTTGGLDEYPARPGQSLADHVGGVATNVARLLPADATTAWGDDWQTVGRTLAWTHDAGKLTEWFGQYLETGDRSVGPRVEHTYHGFVGALLTAHALHAQDVSAGARLAGFYAVAKHHGVLPALPEDRDDYTSSAQRIEAQYDIARDQLQNIDEYASSAADQLLRTATEGALTWADVYIDNPSAYGNLLKAPARVDGECYETVLRAWSTLVCGDKLDAAGITVPAGGSPRPKIDRLRTHVHELPDGDRSLTRELNELRSEAHDEAWQTLLDRHADGDRLFRLTLPTGFGKTLTGLRAALELAEQEGGRVIYALPYTSIIDQVEGVCQDVFDTDSGDPAYTVHHHLADTRTDLEELRVGDHVSDGSETLFAETWQSGLVLTTFTQLFESAAGPGNTQSMKLPALQDSVIVVDEPQAISLSWWLLVARLSQFLTREYDASVVLMTATQPQLLERVESLPTPTALTNTTDRCVDFLDEHPRVRFRLHESFTTHLHGEADSALDLADAADHLRETTDPGTASLAIVNTVESAARLTEHLGESGPAMGLADQLIDFHRESDVSWGEGTEVDDVARAYLQYLDEGCDHDPGDRTLLATLTTRLRPRDRRLLLACLRRILDTDTATPFDDWPLLTVSTQLIEAGVDVSFDRLYRDFGPLPAIVQAAGRCNREFDGDTGVVTVWRLASPEQDGPIPSELIYGDHSLLRPTRRALRELRADSSEGWPVELSESAIVSTGIDAYYDALHHQRRTSTRSDRLVGAFERSDGETLRRASLIDQDYTTQDVAVLITDTDREWYRSYRRCREAGEWNAARDAFNRLKPLVVTIPIAVDARHAEDAESVAVVDIEADSDCYDIGTARGVTLADSTTALER
jgi:CRISPR-associated endonuclease Cas3-HD